MFGTDQIYIYGGRIEMGDATGKKSVVAVIHREALPGFSGDESDVMTHKPETVAEVEKMIEEAFDKSIGGVKNVIKPGQKVFSSSPTALPMWNPTVTPQWIPARWKPCAV